MLGSLEGTLVAVTPPQVLVNVAGVGYEVDMSVNDLASLPALKDKISLYVHLLIREDAHTLFGFLQLSHRNCFRSLLKVSGIGPRTALALLSTFTPHALQLAVAQGDISALCRTPGIGKKVAERLILELKGKLPETDELSYSTMMGDATTKLGSIRGDIANALASLGYDNKQINLALKQLPAEITELSIGIKEALRLLNVN